MHDKRIHFMPIKITNKITLFAIFFASITNPVSAKAQIQLSAKQIESQRNTGWWVIIDTQKMPISEEEEQQATEGAFDLRHCAGGIPGVFHSDEIKGFKSGYLVIAYGAYKNKIFAQKVQKQISKCVTSSYIKYGQWVPKKP